jgi:hypothetical protein
MLLERRAIEMEQRQDESRLDGVAQYELTGNPHPIQARKAWEDNETWMAGTLLGIKDRVATVAYIDGGDVGGDSTDREQENGLSIGGRVWVTERWGVLAFADEDGNAIAIRSLDELGDSIFGRIGAVRLRFVSAKLVAESPEAPREEVIEFVYGNVTARDGVTRFGIVPRAVAEDTAQFVGVVNSCTSWGEVREMASEDHYSELLTRAGRDEGDPPGDGDVFDPNGTESMRSVEYPMTPYAAHELFLPGDIQDRYGEWGERFLEGSVLWIPVKNGAAVVAELRRRGHTCIENVGLLAAEHDRFEWMSRPREGSRERAGAGPESVTPA